MCSESKDARFPSLLMRKRKRLSWMVFILCCVIKIWNIGLSLLFQVDLALFPAFLMGLWGNVKLHLLGWGCVCVCQCWQRACYVVEKGLGVAGFLGDLLGLSHCREVWSGFYFSPFFCLLPKHHAHWLVGWCWVLPRGRFETTSVQGPSPSSPSCTKEGLLSLVQGPPHLPSLLQGHWQHSEDPHACQGGWMAKTVTLIH